MANPSRPAFWDKLKPVPRGKNNFSVHVDDTWLKDLFDSAPPILIESAGWWRDGHYWTESVLLYRSTQQVNVRYRVNGIYSHEAWFPAVVFGWEGK